MARDRRYTADDQSGTGLVQMTDSKGDAVHQKIPVQGRGFISLTSIEDNNDSATIEVKGTNNQDASDTNGETLLTNTHTGNDQHDARARIEGYDYAFVHITSSGGTENLELLLKLVM